ncbi:hypothetical protein JTB14_012761 [Gonioctena quinquepunctata]|nr:hypothetical protein JTB14_012761 [Gonioctena quinquepunctata]
MKVKYIFIGVLLFGSALILALPMENPDFEAIDHRHGIPRNTSDFINHGQDKDPVIVQDEITVETRMYKRELINDSIILDSEKPSETPGLPDGEIFPVNSNPSEDGNSNQATLEEQRPSSELQEGEILHEDPNPSEDGNSNDAALEEQRPSSELREGEILHEDRNPSEDGNSNDAALEEQRPSSELREGEILHEDPNSGDDGNSNETSEKQLPFAEQDFVNSSQVMEKCLHCNLSLDNETELIGCMCSIYRTEQPSTNDIPLTTRTFQNVKCHQNIPKGKTCGEVCISVAAFNYGLDDNMVCSYVPTHADSFKAYLHSKLCEENAIWEFTGISSAKPICCHMGSVMAC